ncbi:MAG: WD40-repeat-containing domain protein [Benniella sp.]|nr:MAG: WD40-repeat-containing domain protein [Benniella sp.]
MMLGGVASSPLGSLSPEQALELAKVYLDNAFNANDSDIALVLCYDTKTSLSQAKKALKKSENPAVNEGMAAVYIDLGKAFEIRGHDVEAQESYKKAEKYGVKALNTGRPSRSGSIAQSLRGISRSTGGSQVSDTTRPSLTGRKSSSNMVTIPRHIFAENVNPPIRVFKLPEPDERLSDTLQLAGCLGLLKVTLMPGDELEPTTHGWLQAIEKDTDEQDRLRTLATEVIRVFKRDELKDAKAVAEVVYLAPVLSKDAFQDLLSEFYSGIDHSGLLKFHQLEGLAHLLQGANPGHLNADDLVKILGLLSSRLQDTHQQSSHHMHQLTLAVSHVLDAMADTAVKDIDRKNLHEPLSLYLGELKKSTDPYLVYQAAYAYQALLCVPDNETKWQSAMRRSGKVIQGISRLVSSVKGLDLNKFIEGLGEIQEGFAGVSNIVEITMTAYDKVTTLAQSGQGFMDSLKEGFSFDRKRDWYSALRGADALIRDGELATFRELVCKAPCQLDPAFQWGVCQRLGEIAANPMWDSDIRRSAIAFLGEIYKEDAMWGQHVSIKQWIINILMQLASSSGGLQLHTSVAEKQLRELEVNGDDKKQVLYQGCRQRGPESYPLKITQHELASPSLLDRVQSRPDVDVNIRLLRKQRTKGRDNSMYIPPQGTYSLQAGDDTQFPLMEKVKEFLESDQKVFLLLGDSGAGKSTFSRELEYDLWRSYRNKTDRIPLHINLPTIDKPEHDLIAKHLRKAEFTEQQIREMKHYRKFVLICDGYDESQQTHNLYMSNRLNQPGEWDIQMIINCRIEYLGVDYRDRFQPSDRNHQSDSSLYQEAVITPFSLDMVHAYIHQYVSTRQPLWQLEDYKQALELIPSLKDLVTNPFLMTLSLEVLPRMVDPGQHLSTTRVTRVELYDHFVEQWLERGRKRLGEKDMSRQSGEKFERLIAEGFTVNGIGYMKKFAVAIYKEQAGHPVVEYSQLVDEGSWKDEFFKFEDKQLLHEACPLTRSGNQHRFIHRTLLEYALALAIFDPESRRNKISEQVLGRRGSVSSTLSFEVEDGLDQTTTVKEPSSDSPLVWKSVVNDHSLLQFLEERAQQEPLFKKQLLDYIEYSKMDSKWRKAAANAITILVRAGVQFISTDLRGIRIPGADLSYGVFDSAQLQDADMRKANLRGVWMRQTDLSRAQMTGVQFGELPSLSDDDGHVYSCAYSPDGMSFATSLSNGNIHLYVTSTWEKIRTLNGQDGAVLRVVYSPKGDQIASCGQNMTLCLWDTDTGSLLHTLTGHTNWVTCAAYSPQGEHVASVSGDGTMRLWDVTNGDCFQTFSGHSVAIQCVAYSPNGQQIAFGSLDSSIRLWNVVTGDCVRVMSGHDGVVWDISYSPRGDQVASSSQDTTIRLWDVESGACRHIMPGHIGPVKSVVFSPKGDQIASGSLDATVRLWDVDSGVCHQTLNGHTKAILSVTYSPKGGQLASGSFDRSVRLWSVSTGVSRSVPKGHSREVTRIKCSPNGDQIVSCSTDRTIRLWNVDTGACSQILRDQQSPIYSVAYSPQGDRIVSGGGDKTVRLWDVEAGTCIRTLTGHNESVQCVAYSLQGDMVASASIDTTVRVWDTATGDCRWTLGGHSEGVMCVAYSPNGNQIASGSMDGTVRIWDAATGICIRVLQGHGAWVRDVVYSPQGVLIASASRDKTIRLWDVKTGECRSTLEGHKRWVSCAEFSPKGDILVSGSEDMTVRFWDVATGQCRAVVENFHSCVKGITWIAALDSNFLITGCSSGSVLMWQVLEDEGRIHVRQSWSATNGALNMAGASIQDVQGLTQIDKQLLKQRGAVDNLQDLPEETSKKSISEGPDASKKSISEGPDASKKPMSKEPETSKKPISKEPEASKKPISKEPEAFKPGQPSPKKVKRVVGSSPVTALPVEQQEK